MLMNRWLLAGLMLLVGSWLMPHHYAPWLSFHGEFVAGAAALVLSAGVAAHGAYARLPSPVALPALLGLVALGADFLSGRALFASDLGYGLVYLGLWVLAGVAGAHMAATASVSQRDPASAERGAWSRAWSPLAWAILAGALLSEMAGTVQWLRWPTGLWVAASDGRAYANFAQPNHYATLLAMGLAALGMLRAAQRIPHAIWLTGVLLLCCGVLSSESRTGFVAVTITFAGWAAHRAAVTKRVAPWVCLLGALGLWLGARLAWPALAQLVGATASRRASDFSSNGRFDLWQQLGAAVAEQPWIGYGWLQVGRAQDLVAHTLPGPVVGFSHNLFLDVALWFGLPCALLLLLMCVRWLYKSFSVALPERLHPLLLLAPLGLHALLEYPHAYAYFLVPAAIAVGALAQSTRSPAWAVPRWLLSGLMILCALAGMALAQLQISAEGPMRAALADDNRFGAAAPAEVPLVAMGLGGDVKALVQALSHTGPESAASMEQAQRVAWRYPQKATHRRRVMSQFLGGQAVTACRSLQAFRSLYGLEQYQNLLVSLRLALQSSDTPFDIETICQKI